MAQEKCFVCDKPLTASGRKLVDTRDDQKVFVGPNCFKKIEKAGPDGYQPKFGGPRLWPVR